MWSALLLFAWFDFMAYRNNRRQSSASKAPSPRGGAPAKKNGFSQLDPARMGLDMPDWLDGATEASVDDEQPGNDRRDKDASAASARTLLEGMKVVCICKGIKMRTFWRAMDEGAQTHEQVDQATGSGSGQCQGRRCGPRILEMLRNLPS